MTQTTETDNTKKKREYQICITTDKNGPEVLEAIDNSFKDLRKEFGGLVQVYDINEKFAYSKEDELHILMRLEVRIPKEESSEEFISAFKIMFAFWEKMRDSEDGKYLSLDFGLKCLNSTLGKLSNISCFLSRCESLGFKGVIEGKISVSWSNFGKDESKKSEQETINQLLDQHVKLLKWTKLNKYIK